MSVEPARKDLGVWYNPLTWPGDIANSITWLGIPFWVWLIGAGGLVAVLVFSKNKPIPQTESSIQIVDMQRRRKRRKIASKSTTITTKRR